MANKVLLKKVYLEALKSQGMILRSSFLILILTTIFVFSANRRPSDSDPVAKEKVILTAVLDFLRMIHFEPHALDDDLSTKVFEDNLNNIDNGRRFLTQQDLTQLERFRLDLDDQAKAQDFTFFDLSYELLNSGITKVQVYYEEILTEPFDFTIDESIEFDPDKKEFAKDDDMLREYWRKMLKYETLVKLNNKLEAQEEAEDGDIKSFTTLEAEAREEVLKTSSELFERINEMRRSDRYEVFLNTITNYFDPHTNYFNPKEKQDFEIRLSNTLEGIGARLGADGEFTKIASIVPGGPAYKEGHLRVDDRILKVRQESEELAKDVVGWRIDDVVQLIRGKKGTKVTLLVRHTDNQTEEITITRDKIILEQGWAKSALLEEEASESKYGYIKVPSFYSDIDDRRSSSCSKDVAEEITKLTSEGAEGIILDLRFNGGGYLHEVVDMTGLFIEEGPIVQVRGRRGQSKTHFDRDDKVHYDGPLVVLVNSFSASASEILAAALQDYQRAVIVGSKATYGKGTVQSFYNLDRVVRSYDELKPLGEVKITTQKYYRVDGGSVQLHGVTPDIVLPDRYQFIKVGEREYDTSMDWSEIAAVDYTQDVWNMESLGVLREQSQSRIAENETFQLILEDAKRLKRQRDRTSYSLNLARYQEEKRLQKEENQRFKNILKPLENLTVRNLESDLAEIQADSTNIGRNEAWLKNLRKDIYLEESVNILTDIIMN